MNDSFEGRRHSANLIAIVMVAVVAFALWLSYTNALISGKQFSVAIGLALSMALAMVVAGIGAVDTLVQVTLGGESMLAAATVGAAVGVWASVWVSVLTVSTDSLTLFGVCAATCIPVGAIVFMRAMFFARSSSRNSDPGPPAR